MCGRYTYYSAADLLEHYKLEDTENLRLALDMQDDYNVAPGAHMPVIVRGDQANIIEFMIWGLVPKWSKSPESELKLINARSENLTEKPMWKGLVKSKRCIVPARGFYEWQKLPDGKKQPYYISPKRGDVMSFAGLFDHWQDSDGVELLSFCIVTTTPNKDMEQIHNRMPVILDDSQADVWLSPLELEKDLLHDLLGPAPDDTLNIEKVSTKVNYAGHNDRELIYPLSVDSSS